MNTTAKFQIVTTTEFDHSLDGLGAEARKDLLDWMMDDLANIRRRDAIAKANTPMGTVFTFQHGALIVTALYRRMGDDQRRTMFLLSLGAIV